MVRAKTYSKARVEELMTSHYPVCTDEQYDRWYCGCGVYVDHREGYDAHVKKVLRKEVGDVEHTD